MRSSAAQWRRPSQLEVRSVGCYQLTPVLTVYKPLETLAKATPFLMGADKDG